MKLILEFLQFKTNVPIPYGIYHCSCILLVLLSIILLIKLKPKMNKVLFIYSSVAFLLELLKQFSWSFELSGNNLIFDYQWYAFPFQLCTTPIYVCFLILMIKNDKIKTALTSYLAYITILGSITTMIYPTSCFVSDVLVNIHTMWLHGGSLVVSIYILSTMKLNYKDSIYVFLVFIMIANLLNIIVYHLDILNGETFNMFYISPYFVSSLPIFDIVYMHVPYIFFLFFYIFVILLGSFIIYSIHNLMQHK